MCRGIEFFRGRGFRGDINYPVDFVATPSIMKGNFAFGYSTPGRRGGDVM